MKKSSAIRSRCPRCPESLEFHPDCAIIVICIPSVRACPGGGGGGVALFSRLARGRMVTSPCADATRPFESSIFLPFYDFRQVSQCRRGVPGRAFASRFDSSSFSPVSSTASFVSSASSRGSSYLFLPNCQRFEAGNNSDDHYRASLSTVYEDFLRSPLETTAQLPVNRISARCIMRLPARSPSR